MIVSTPSEVSISDIFHWTERFVLWDKDWSKIDSLTVGAVFCIIIEVFTDVPAKP